MEKYFLAVLVRNHSGVLARVASLFGRRGYNIDSLTVSATNDPTISRMSIVVGGDRPVLEQVIKQVSKLYEVIWVQHLEEAESHCRELVFVRVSAKSATERDDIRQLCALYHADVVDTDEKSMILALSEVPSRITAFLDVIGNFTIEEMCRSGVTMIAKS